MSGFQIWMYSYGDFNVLLILDSYVILVCLYSCRLMKIREILSACRILNPFSNLREFPSHTLLHRQNRVGMDIQAIGILWIST